MRTSRAVRLRRRRRCPWSCLRSRSWFSYFSGDGGHEVRLNRSVAVSLRATALLYLTLLLVVPVGMIFIKTFEHGLGTAWDWVTTPAAISAFSLSVMIAAIAVP